MKRKYPRVGKANWKNVKLNFIQKIAIPRMYKQGVPRKELATIFNVSYHAIYLLTCPQKTYEKYLDTQKKNRLKYELLRKTDPERKKHAQDLQNAYRARARTFTV